MDFKESKVYTENDYGHSRISIYFSHCGGCLDQIESMKLALRVLKLSIVKAEAERDFPGVSKVIESKTAEELRAIIAEFKELNNGK